MLMFIALICVVFFEQTHKTAGLNEDICLINIPLVDTSLNSLFFFFLACKCTGQADMPLLKICWLRVQQVI
jgi:hypothetical protein